MVNMFAKFDEEAHRCLVFIVFTSLFPYSDLNLWPVTSKFNRVHPLIMVNMSAKFDGEAQDGLVYIVFTRLRCDAHMHGTTAALLYPLRNTLCGITTLDNLVSCSSLCPLLLLFILFICCLTSHSTTLILSYMCEGTYMCAGGLKKKLDLRSGSHAIDISEFSLTCPFKHRHGANFLRLFRETAPFQLPFTTRMEIPRSDLFSSYTPRVPRRYSVHCNYMLLIACNKFKDQPLLSRLSFYFEHHEHVGGKLFHDQNTWNCIILIFPQKSFEHLAVG